MRGALFSELNLGMLEMSAATKKRKKRGIINRPRPDGKMAAELVN